MTITPTNPQATLVGSSVTTRTIASYAPGATNGPLVVVTGARAGSTQSNTVNVSVTFGGVAMLSSAQLEQSNLIGVTSVGVKIFYLDPADFPATPADIVATWGVTQSRAALAAIIQDGAATGGPSAANGGTASAEPLDISVTTTANNSNVIGGFFYNTGTGITEDPGPTQTGQVEQASAAAVSVALMLSSKAVATAGASVSGVEQVGAENFNSSQGGAAGVLAAWEEAAVAAGFALRSPLAPFRHLLIR